MVIVTKILIFSIPILLCSLFVAIGSQGVQETEGMTEQLVDSTNNNLGISMEAPDSWNSGTVSENIADLNWRLNALNTINGDTNAFFVVINLPSLANFALPLGQKTGLLSLLLSQYVTINRESDITDNRRILPNKIMEVITSEQWHTGWRNRLFVEREEDEHEDTFYVPTGSDVRFFHVKVTNNHNLKTAHECSVYLNSITNLNDGTVRRPPIVEFKWQGMKNESVIILPIQTRCFDAFFVEKQIPNIIHLGINPFLLDFSGFYQPYIITAPGDYELQFELASREFQSIRTRFSLHIGTNLEDLRLSIRQ
jgi:hypothetical protein